MAAVQVPYLGVPAGRTGLFQLPEPIPGLPEPGVTEVLQSTPVLERPGFRASRR